MLICGIGSFMPTVCRKTTCPKDQENTPPQGQADTQRSIDYKKGDFSYP